MLPTKNPEFAMPLLQALNCVEMFAGDAAVSKSTRYGLVASARLDIKYGEQVVHKVNAFDLNSPPGLPCLGYTINYFG